MDEAREELRGSLKEAPETHPEGEATGSGSRQERRGKPRISIPFQARVRGLDASGHGFEIDLLLDNLSASGLYLRLPWQVSQGAKLFVVIRLSTVPEKTVSALQVATRGVVVRTESQPDGTYGVGVAFTQTRFL